MNFPELIAYAKGQSETLGGWSRTLIQQTEQRTLYRLDPTDPDQYPTLTVKIFHDEPELCYTESPNYDCPG